MLKRTRDIQKALSESGYRITQPRQAVIEVILRARRSLSPEEILARARKIDPGVGLATVYRTLDVLHAEGYLERVRIGNKGYTLTCTEKTLHFHLICERCRTVTELQSDRFSRDLMAQLRAAGFEARKHAIEIIGRCAKCQPSE
ncbi:MAG: Fur family transcriptional regulator [Anaerolineae bacterium]|nr:transcriptional repressor [Candidatus Roseilinea sp.]MDW8451547.1 Fur family transcriptional regulator [Anaerolineae bacterium]